MFSILHPPLLNSLFEFSQIGAGVAVTKRVRTRPILCGQGHSHILKLEVLLEGISRDEPESARRDGAGRREH